MNDIATLAIPVHTLCRLLQYVNAHPAELSAGELAAKAIEEWLACAGSDKVRDFRQLGYQWKSVFLPEGTQLRAWNRTGFAYAEVIGDAIIFRGESVSPHAFICRCKGISRSAWAEVTLLFPNENHWKRADAQRRELNRQPVSPSFPATTPEPQQPSQTPAGFSTVLPPFNAAAPTQASQTRLPRVAPIPTQARHQSSSRFAATDRQAFSPDRRHAGRRQSDLLLG